MKPNILVFVTDQHRADWLSCMGNQQLQTPHIDAIAKDGLVFDRAYCNTPLCMPSRATMFTGLPASGHELRTNGVDMEDRFATLPGILAENGYKTISVGKLHLKPWHLSPEKSPNVQSYSAEAFPECETVWNRHLCEKLPEGYFGLQVSHFLGGHGSYCFGEYLNWLQAEHPEAYRQLTQHESAKPSTRPQDNYYSTVPNELYYNEWIKNLTIQEMQATGENEPFFLWCSFPDPHFPFGPPAPYNTLFNKDDMPDPIAWDDDRRGMNELYHADYCESRGLQQLDGGPVGLSLEQIKETKALAWGMVKSVDDSIGQVMAALEKSGKRDNTIVIFLADHGELMGDHGLYCKGPFHYEGLLHIPLIISAPGMKAAGRHTAALASVLDFMPTVLDLAGVDYAAPPVPDWQGLTPTEKIYEGVPRLPGKSLKPLLDDPNATVQGSVLVEDDDDYRGVNIRTLITQRYKLTVYGGKGYGELFDLEADPEERRNLWDDAASQSLKADMMAKLADKMIEDAPRLRRRYGVA